MNLKVKSNEAIEPSRLKLIRASEKAMANALAPYSNFLVGAALQTKSGVVYCGHNIESSSYSLTICAERVALFKALSEGEREFESIAIVASSGDFCPPCGACRQVLSDFASDLTIILADSKHHIKLFSLADLLPESFSEKNLDRSLLHDLSKTARKASSSKSPRRKN